MWDWWKNKQIDKTWQSSEIDTNQCTQFVFEKEIKEIWWWNKDSFAGSGAGTTEHPQAKNRITDLIP